MQNLKTCALLLLALFFLVSIPYSHATDTHSYGAVVLMDKVVDKFDKQGKEIWYEHEKIKLLNQKGIQELGEVVIPFSSKYQRLKVLKAITILPSGKTLKPAQNAYNIVSPPFVMQAPIYSDLKYQTISMPGLRPGAIIEYSYELKTIKPYMPGNFWSKDSLGGKYPVKKASYTLYVPKNKIPKIILNHIKINPKKIEKRDKIIIKFMARNLPPIDEEPYGPPMGELAPSIAISTVRTWDDVANWYMKLAKKALEPDELVRKTAIKITKGIDSKWEKIRAIYNYVSQNIRYVGVEFGISGYKPHPAPQIFRLRYGDCKDHSTLLIAMLKAIGIKAYPVLIPTAEIANLDKRLPMPGAFDHEITAVRLKNQYIFLDSTAESASCGDLPPSDQGRRVLIVGDNNKAVLTNTPVFPPLHNQEVYTGTYSMDRSGGIKGEGKFKYKGVYAMYRREQFMHMTSQEKKREIEKIINKLSPGSSITELKLSNYTDLNNPYVTISFKLKDPDYATRTSHLLFFNPPLLSFSHLTSFVAATHRKYPYCLGYCFSKVARIKMYIPNGYKLKFIPEDFTYKNKLGTLELKWMTKGRLIEITELLKLNRSRISAHNYPLLRDLFMQAVKLNRNQVLVLKKLFP